MSGATKQQEIKKARKGRYLQTEMWRSHPETRSPRAAAMPRKCCVSPRSFPASLSAIQLGSVGTHSRLRRATRAAGEPDASSSAEVKHELYNHTAVRCRLLCRAAYLKTPKYEGKGGEKQKTPLWNISKNEPAFRWLLGLPHSLPSCPLRGPKKHYLLAWTFVSLVKKTILIPPSTFTGAENSTNYCREIIYRNIK